MPYADRSAVVGRAGFIGAAWHDNSTPSLSTIDGFLHDVSLQIDGAIAGGGYETPVTNPDAAGALRSLCADCALVLTLEAHLPGGEGHAQASDLIESARRRCEAGMLALGTRQHPAIVILDTAGGGTEAGDFWTDNPDYGRWPEGDAVDPLRPRDPNLDPEYVKGHPF
jgi:hypothetical protein